MPEAAYATQADFEAYVEGWVTDDPDALDRLLIRATDDVDSILGDYVLYDSGPYMGRKLNPPDDLTFTENRALTRATCAQAEYRNTMGEEHFVRPRLHSSSGPEFTIDESVPWIGPKAMRELAGTGLIRNTIALGAGRRVPSWLPIVRNLPDFDDVP